MRTAVDMFRGSGFATLVLLIVVVWALAAVALLVVTLAQSDDIQDNAAIVADQTGGADADLEAVARLQKTIRLAKGIDSELEPLPRILGEEVAATHAIRRNSRQILAEVGSIRGHVSAIERGAASVNAHVSSIGGYAGSIRVDVTTIRSLLLSTLDIARSIDGGVAGINVRAGRAIDRADEIEHDLSDVDRHAGPEHRNRRTGPTIAGHAHSIDCSALVSPQRKYCTP